MNVAQIGLKLREQMQSFLGNLALPKTARRFVLEALWGIQTRQSLRLSEIARALAEPIALIKTENRLSRQAARKGLAERLTDWVIGRHAGRIGRDTLLILDPSDLAKPHARKMEHLARVRDGSRKELVNGYWLCQVVGVECGGHGVVPLVNHLWSQKAPGHRSENVEILDCIRRVARAAEGRGIWVIDRGGDRGELFKMLMRPPMEFIVRLKGDRDLLCGSRKALAADLARGCPLPYAETVRTTNSDGSERVTTIEFGARPVRLPGYQRTLWLVVARGWGEAPLMLLTTRPLGRGGRKRIWWVIEAYLTRWRIEETLRFAKQTYALEDVRVLGYESLKNMMALALVAMAFSMVYLGQQTRLAVLAHHALRAARRFFGVPDFFYYAVADGIREILSKRRAPPFDFHPRHAGPSAQLDLFGCT